MLDTRDKRPLAAKPWELPGPPGLGSPNLGIYDPHEAVLCGSEADIQRLVTGLTSSGLDPL